GFRRGERNLDAHNQAVLTDQLGEDALQRAAIHLPVDLLLVVARLGGERHTTAAPDRAADGTCAGTTGALLTPRLLAAATYFRTGFLCLAALTASSHVGHDHLVYQRLIEVFPEGDFRHRNSSSRGSIEIHPLYPLSGLRLDCRANNDVG